MTHMPPGYCKVCGAPTHEIVKQRPSGHPLAGRPTKIGAFLPDVVKAHMLLTNGTWATIAVHRDCAAIINPETLPELWQNCLATARWEEDHRSDLGAARLKPKQKEQIEKFLVRLASAIPLGVACIEELT